MSSKKQYATTTTPNASCSFRREYSYYRNAICLDCMFCYRKLEVPGSLKMIQAQLLYKEKLYTNNLFKTPIIISKMCDPLCTDKSTEHSLEAMKIILEHNGQIIFRSAISDIKDNVVDFINKNKKHILYQPRVYMFDEFIRDKLTKNFPSVSTFEGIIKKIDSDKCLYIDPVIYFLNDVEIYKFFEFAADNNINKITFKMLYATDYFRNWLTNFVSKNYKDFLSLKSGEYWTYNEEVFLKIMKKIILNSDKFKHINVSFCGHFNKNCCQFKNPKGVFVQNSLLLRNPSIEVL